MKKKILLIIMMFMFITNVNALTFNVNVTNIEDEGNNGTIGSITDIDVANKEVSAYFQDIGDEVNFSITVTNTGDRAGTLRSIDFESGNDKIEYTSNLPEGGLAINGNDTNKVIVTARVKEGAVNGKTTSEVKIKYTYDEGSCPDGEILSEDESMCLCPEGLERNEQGICVKPDKPVECAEDEIYNTEKKICEKKLIPGPDKEDDKPTPKPINPSNPKTLDNIILITLLFFVSGLGIYAVLFKKLKTNKQKVTGGVITGVITLSLSFTVLAGVFGLDNLLSAIVNPITKSKELVVTVNEEIDLIETWDGECSLDVSELTPENIFQGGTGTESDPYQIKTAEQLSCFAKSINNGTTYAGQYVKQTKNIKLNDSLNEQAEAGNLSGVNLWLTAGSYFDGYNIDNSSNPQFRGTYDGDNHVISGLYITDDSAAFGTMQDDWGNTRYSFLGMFGQTRNATLKNMILSDVYATNTRGNIASLVGFAYESLTLDNIKTYGTITTTGADTAGIVSNFNANSVGILTIKNTVNYIDVTGTYGVTGILERARGFTDSGENNIIIQNSGNEGNLTFLQNSGSGGGILGDVTNPGTRTLVENCYNKGDFYAAGDKKSLNVNGGLIGDISGILTMNNCYNTGDFYVRSMIECGGLIGSMIGTETYIDSCYNSGNMVFEDVENYLDGVTYDTYSNNYDFSSQSVGGIAGNVSKKLVITNSYNSGKLYGPVSYMAGLVGVTSSSADGSCMENCYNVGDIAGKDYVGGLVGTGPKTITKSYNTGKISIFGSIRGGGIVGYDAGDVSNVYNLGDIYLTGKLGSSGQIGGICADCITLKNSYNRGNIYAKYNAEFVGGLIGLSTGVTNSYNTGNIIFDDADPSNRSSILIGGIGAQGTSTNTYNTGDITVKVNKKRTSGSQTIAGINTQGDSTNSVNTGNISVIFADPSYIWGIDVYGICYGKANDNFQAGTLSFGNDHVVTDSSNGVYIGEINGSIYNSTGNKFKNPDGVALGCIGRWNSCNLEASQNVGVYTTENAPDIMSVINGDDAFEIKEGETLPTLKVFNN